jgi:hypothetical protein
LTVALLDGQGAGHPRVGPARREQPQHVELASGQGLGHAGAWAAGRRVHGKGAEQHVEEGRTGGDRVAPQVGEQRVPGRPAVEERADDALERRLAHRRGEAGAP